MDNVQFHKITNFSGYEQQGYMLQVQFLTQNSTQLQNSGMQGIVNLKS